MTMPNELGDPSISHIGNILNDEAIPLKDRFRALFTLKNLGGKEAIEEISRCFGDSSSLLKHELAYCLGQMQDIYAVPVLISVLENKSQEAMVRHEAGEALGAIGSTAALEVVKKFCCDPVVEVAETCQLAVERIEWSQSGQSTENLPANPFMSVDPSPPCVERNVEQLKRELLDETKPLFKRYRAMFSLRNIGTEDCVLALAEGLKCKSALFRHEIAYVLGQLQNSAGVSQLADNLKDLNENPMVRHECAEALGAIATSECTDILENFLKDNERVVRESCLVALDMSEYENSNRFQYADFLEKVKSDKLSKSQTDSVGHIGASENK